MGGFQQKNEPGPFLNVMTNLGQFPGLGSYGNAWPDLQPIDEGSSSYQSSHCLERCNKREGSGSW